MAKIISIDSKQFELLFQHTLDKLEIAALNANKHNFNPESQAIRDLHRAFHYYIHELKRNLEEAPAG